MQKISIGVLMGGKSAEREVSFNSGRTICDHLDTACYDIVPFFQTQSNVLYILPWPFLHRGKIIDFEHRLERQAQRILWDEVKNLVDLMYIAQHGRYAEDGTMQGLLEVLGIPYVGSKVFASALGMDKIMQKHLMRAVDIIVPRDVIVLPHELDSMKEIFKRIDRAAFSFPCIVKPHQEGSSLGTSVVHNQDQLENALKKACYINSKPQAALIEEKIQGKEFSCIIITDYKTGTLMPLPPTEIVTPSDVQFFDYDQKYMPGWSLQFTPARFSAQQIQIIQQTCLRVIEILGFSNLGRIDGFLTPDNRIVIIDPNSFSGAAPSSFLFKQAAQIGMNHTQLINHLIETELHSSGMGVSVIKRVKKQDESTKKIRVAVLLGGKSNEKEISLESGRNVVYKLSPHTYEAIPLFVDKYLHVYRLDSRLLVANTTEEIQEQLDSSMCIAWHDLPSLADFIFIALHGGHGENGSVQGMLEILGLPYNGSSVLASAMCMDKAKTNAYLKSQAFDVPKSMLIAKDQWQKDNEALGAIIEKTIAFPCVVKPHDDGCSMFVSKVSNKENLAECIDQIFKNKKSHVLVEEYISGMELTVGVLGNDEVQALPPSQAVVSADILSIEEKFLPGAGENQTPAPLPDDTLKFVQRTIERVFKSLSCKGYARIDCFYQNEKQSPTGKERVVILEVNTLPGLTPATCIFHQAAEMGLKPMDFIDHIIRLGLQEHGVNNSILLTDYQKQLIKEKTLSQ
jgi:D-alanine--D-alanine ligase